MENLMAAEWKIWLTKNRYFKRKNCGVKKMLMNSHKELREFYWKKSRVLNVTQGLINQKL